MLREIKFRAYHKDKKEMICGTLDFWFQAIAETGKNPLRQNIEFMQFTGLKDKNGKEIYEGDIVKTENKIYNFEIIFSNGSFGVLDRTARLTPFWQIKECEVIGNIYEHKNLLDNTELLNN